MRDKNGVPINVGDEVLVRARIESTVGFVETDVVTCNVRTESGNVLTLDASRLEKVGGGNRDVQEAAERGAGVRKEGK